MAINSVIIDQDLDKFVEYKYVITEFYIITNGVSDPFPVERISDFKIDHYFDEATFPIFKLTCIMEASRYYNMIKNKANVKFKLRIQSYYTVRGGQEKSLMTDVINDTFSFFPDDDSDDLEKDQKKEANTYDDINKLEKLNNIVELFLFKDSFVTGLRSSFNAVLNNVNLSTAVTYLLYKAGVKKVLMSPFENTTTYKTLVLPPQSIEKQLKYLNNNYGFHTHGTMIYFGLFHSYILNYVPKCTAWYKKEWTETVIFVLEKSNPLSYLSGAIIKPDEKRYYYNAKTEGITVSSGTVSSNVITGTNATTIDMQNSNTINATSKAKTVGKQNSAILFNNSSNKYMATVYTTQQSANSTIISLALDNVKLDAFNPNKVFTFVFENAEYNKKYKGIYKISSALYNFTSNGGNYTLTAVLTFKKVS